jgi:hypothetical protein
VRTQYHFWPAERGEHFDAWSVTRLIGLSRDLPRVDVPVDSIAELDVDYWTDAATEPTVRRVLAHTQAILAVDTSPPIILGPDGRLMDGMHRVCRAVLDGRSSLAAVRFATLPSPDVRNCRISDLA